MMDRVTCRPIDDGTIGNVFSVVNHYGPEVDEGKQAHIGQFLQRKDEWEDMVWQALGKAVQRVKGVARKRGRHYPFVVRFMKRLVDSGVMQTTVDPVDEEVGEEE